MNYARRFAWHAAMTVGTAVLGGALFYLLRIVLYKHLSQEEYGLFYVLFSYATVIQTATTFGFDPGLVPYVTRFREEDNPGAIKALALGALVPQAILTVVVIVAFVAVPPLLAPWAASVARPSALVRILADPVAPGLFRILALHAVLVLFFKCGQQVLLGLQSIAWRNAADVARAVTCLGCAVLLLRGGWGVYATAAAYTLGALVETVTIGIALAVAHPRIVRAPFAWQPRQVREVFDAGKWLSIGFGGVVLFSSLDTIVISLVRQKVSDAAAYQIALPTVTILYSLMIAAGVTLLPTVRTLWLRGEHTILSEGVHQLYSAAIAIMLPTGALLASTSDVLMTALFGPEILNAADAFNVLAVGGIVFFLAYINLHILAGIDQPRIAGVAVLCGLALDLALNLPLTSMYGIRGTAIAGVSGYALAAAIGFAGLRRLLPVMVPARAITGSILLAIGAAAVAWQLRKWGQIGIDHPFKTAALVLSILTMVLVCTEFIGFIKLRKLISVNGRPEKPLDISRKP